MYTPQRLKPTRRKPALCDRSYRQKKNTEMGILFAGDFGRGGRQTFSKHCLSRNYTLMDINACIHCITVRVPHPSTQTLTVYFLRNYHRLGKHTSLRVNPLPPQEIIECICLSICVFVYVSIPMIVHFILGKIAPLRFD